MQPGEREFQGTARFVVKRRLGEGGRGVVWEALDKERLVPVALKTLRALGPEALLRFKHEFRALQDVSHPNLVALGELIEEAGQWFFTMELVRGVGLGGWVRPDGVRVDEARLRAAFAQLAAALAALHARGLVHGAVKASNVLVGDDGRVKLLDCGVVADAGGAAADWRAFGALLHEALGGARPPADLDALCRALAHDEVTTRPSGDEVLRRLGATPSPKPPLPASAQFVGRREELAELDAALAASRERGAIVVVHGESGVGKSAVVRRFLDELAARAPDAVALPGRCYERESVCYKAVDGAIDALTRWLASLPGDEAAALLPSEIALAAELFPVLQRVDAVERAPAPATPEDPPELRTRAFAALRALFCAIGARGPLVVAVDDLQWADADSLALLAELLRAPDAPRLLLVATVRADDDRVPAALAARLGAHARLLPVRPLGPNEARELAAALLGGAAGEGPLSAAVIAAEAHGHPLFIDELVRHKLEHQAGLANPPLQLDDALHARIERLDGDARRVLELTAVAGAPLVQGTAAVAAACDFDEFARIATRLRAQNLVRTSGVRAADTVEPYHDRVREAVLRRLDAAARKMRHGRLALALEAGKQADAQALALHFAEAGDRDKAARYTSIAADEAAGALALDRAVTLYRDALALAPAGSEARRTLALKVGEALANAGRGAEAARAYELAAELQLQPATASASEALVRKRDQPSPSDEERLAMALELRRRAAEQYLRGGHVDDGLAAVRSVLGVVGLALPRTPTGALVSLLFNRARVRLRGLGFRERAAADVPPPLLQRLDTCLSVATGMGLVDTIRGADFQTRALLFALRAGEPGRVARALAMEAAHSSAGGGKTRARTARLIASAEALAERLPDAPEVQALVLATSGITSFLEGRWRQAHRRCSDAERSFRDRCVGTAWEADSAQAFSLWALSYLGEMRELARRVPQAIREAEERGDRYAATNLRIGELNFVHLVAGDVAGARAAAAEAMRAWSHQGFHHQHWDNLLAEATTDLYAGDAAGAWQRVRTTWPALSRSLLLMIQLTRIEATHLRGRAALASALLTTGRERARLVGEARRAAKRLHGEKMAWATPLGRLLDAGIARAVGEKEAARAALTAARDGFVATDMALFAAVTRAVLGRLVAGDEGRALVAAADGFFAAQAICDPARVIATLAPGCVD